MKIVATAGEDLEVGDLVYFTERRGELFALRVRSESEVADPETADPAAPAEAPAPDESKDEDKSALLDALDDAEPKDENGGTKPPEDGLCRECKRRRPLNRLKLCYPCFVELVIIDEAKKRGYEWKTGNPHPDWCACEGLGEHRKPDGTYRGAN